MIRCLLGNLLIASCPLGMQITSNGEKLERILISMSLLNNLLARFFSWPLSLRSPWRFLGRGLRLENSFRYYKLLILCRLVRVSKRFISSNLITRLSGLLVKGILNVLLKEMDCLRKSILMILVC